MSTDKSFTKENLAVSLKDMKDRREDEYDVKIISEYLERSHKIYSFEDTVKMLEIENEI